MPVRLLNSSILKWPDAKTVITAARHWVENAIEDRNDVLAIGYFGSYARGDWGVGSDLDIIIILEKSSLPFIRRAIEWDTTKLPVPTDVLVYTNEEWQKMKESRFYKTIIQEAVWIYEIK